MMTGPMSMTGDGVRPAEGFLRDRDLPAAAAAAAAAAHHALWLWPAPAGGRWLVPRLSLGGCGYCQIASYT